MGLNIDASSITSGIINKNRLPTVNGSGTSVDEVWVGTSPPTDPNVELWYDPSAVADGGPSGPTAYIHTQAVAADTWVIEHALGFYPNVTVVDSAGDEVVGDVNYPSTTTVVLSFSEGLSGAAYLS